ncbi:MAG: hypothetical protein ACRD3T_01945 [Terriglobia bacterium]
MSTSKPRRPSPAQSAASRANGLKSKGPKTPAGKEIVSLNALKDGTTARSATRPLWQAMVDLGEDPGRYRSMLRDVMRSYPPRNPLELKMCEEITRLLLKSERVQQAQEAKLVRTYQKLEIAREKHLREIERNASYDALQTEVLETGLRRAPNSPAKFSEAMTCLERLRDRVAAGDFSDQTELNALYGANPTFRGAGIINAFRALAERPDDGELVASLRLMLLEEMRDVAAEHQLYYREHVEISRAMRLECLVPAADREFLQLQRQENAVHRQLERKIKLLLMLQAASRRRAAETGKEDSDQAPVWDEAPVGWLDSTSQADRDAALAGLPASVASAEPAATPDARALALRHKLGVARRAGASSKEQHQEVVRRIHEIYGLAPPEPGKQPSATDSRRSEQDDEPAAEPQNTPAEAAEEGRMDSEGSQN